MLEIALSLTQRTAMFFDEAISDSFINCNNLQWLLLCVYVCVCPTPLSASSQSGQRVDVGAYS